MAKVQDALKFLSHPMTTLVFLAFGALQAHFVMVFHFLNLKNYLYFGLKNNADFFYVAISDLAVASVVGLLVATCFDITANELPERWQKGDKARKAWDYVRNNRVSLRIFFVSLAFIYFYVGWDGLFLYSNQHLGLGAKLSATMIIFYFLQMNHFFMVMNNENAFEEYTGKKSNRSVPRDPESRRKRVIVAVIVGLIAISAFKASAMLSTDRVEITMSEEVVSGAIITRGSDDILIFAPACDCFRLLNMDTIDELTILN
ncbi:hypothetical protein ACOTTU_12795 [Roseobacter sp. EG26]|uniref:hypothetical protein n=1 Tax=Roseobacter sp. EG26 TaxID=3412477 RepID=UPI003CE524F1